MHPWISEWMFQFSFLKFMRKLSIRIFHILKYYFGKIIHQALCVQVQCLSTSSTDVSGSLNDWMLAICWVCISSKRCVSNYDLLTLVRAIDQLMSCVLSKKWFSACQLLKRSLDMALCVSECFHQLFHNLCISVPEVLHFALCCWLTSQLYLVSAFAPFSFVFYYIFHFFKFPLFLINSFCKLNQHGLIQNILKCHLNQFQIQVLIKTNLRSNCNSNPSYVMWAI